MCVCACMRVCVCLRVRAYVRTCMRSCVRIVLQSGVYQAARIRVEDRQKIDDRCSYVL
jgi:hypothetical protein